MTTNMLNERYQVIRTLGAGGFGETYLAEDTYMPSKRRCVVKQLRPIQNNPQIYQLVQERFQREAAILEELGGSSDQIPSLYAYFESAEQFYLVQEWVEGDTLTAKVQKQGLLSERAVQELLLNLLPILEYVHSKFIVHRDIKPDNIIIRHRDNKPVLIDFGAVRESMGTVVNSQGNPTSSIVIGTPGYMPSEQAAGRPVYSSDLYSLGVTAIYLLTGMQPQQLGTDPQTAEILWRHYTSQISPMMAEVIDKAIAYHPRDRYPTARAMLDALQSLAHPIPATQPVFNPPPVVSPPPPTIPVAPQFQQQSNNENYLNNQNISNWIILGALIVGGLIGASVIISQVLSKPSDTLAQITNSPTATPSNFASSIPETPAVAPSTVQPSIETPQVTPTPTNPIIPTPISTQANITTTDNYLWLSQRPVNDADLAGKSGYDLDIMRNTIFAVHGRKFDTPGLQDYFNQQPWYNPQYSPKEFPSSKLLSKLEQKNVDYIAKYQDKYNLRYFKR